MASLRWLSVIIAGLALLAPAAHVLEMPNKLALDGPVWLAVQQQLYRGWGPLVGAPTQIGGLLVNLALMCARSESRKRRIASAVAACSYLGMLASFFVFNAPVNAAVAHWSAASLPPDWTAYRYRWEAGHAISSAFGLVAFVAVYGGMVYRSLANEQGGHRYMQEDVPSWNRF